MILSVFFDLGVYAILSMAGIPRAAMTLRVDSARAIKAICSILLLLDRAAVSASRPVYELKAG